ncbi:hypothetical protein [Opitutus sp. ER46]|uniref:hypothetical protein n=1 Tax=Opitutus sp. ER46 TaxID=2161864 RepID=UPI000D2FE161|nr:hypothetical protein [Opitutus sp. ER46]PTX92331.1 hypothetical protein DB354_13390 [Opitutus sp. ER46]
MSQQTHQYPETPISAPDVQKGIEGLKSVMHGGGAFDPPTAVVEGVKAGNDILGFIRMAGFWFARGMILPAELTFRQRIGERYVGGPCLLVLLACVYLLNGMNAPNGQEYTRMIDIGRSLIIIAVVAIGFVLHARRLRSAQKNGVHWHSYSEGDSLLEAPLLQQLWARWRGPYSTVSIAKNILEPLAVLIVGVFLLPDNLRLSKLIVRPQQFAAESPLPTYLIVMGVTMFAYQYYCSRIRRGQLLDHLDAELMIEALTESRKGNQAPGLRDFLGVAVLPAKRIPKEEAPAPNPQQSAPVPAVAPAVSTMPFANIRVPETPSTPVTTPYTEEKPKPKKGRIRRSPRSEVE